MLWFKPKMHGVRISIRPLQGLGEDRKATKKFVKKYFKKCGNFDNVMTEIETARVNGTFTITGKVKAGVANKLRSLQHKLGIEVDVDYDGFSLGKKLRNIVKYYEDKGQSWVVSDY